MSKVKGQNYMHGAAILTIGVVIMKILGFIYKIPLGNILGDEGFSMFTSAYNIYYVFFTLATAGLPVALSRLVAEADANGRAKQEEKTFRVALLTFFVIGAVFALILYLFPNWLADNYLENPDAAPSIRAMAPSILLVCLVSAYRGYCQGNGNMLPTTVDEVLEVLFKVISGLILSAVIINMGTNIFFNSISSLTNSVMAILQLVLSMDYSIMLMNRFRRERQNGIDKETALIDALTGGASSILSSAVTTIVGLLCLVFMNFTIGVDMGVVLAKGVVISLISVFTVLPGLIIIFDKPLLKCMKKRSKFSKIFETEVSAEE